jgi:hypothetical protein
MPGPIYRNLVVKYFGTPAATEGTVNEPRERQEHGRRFNEKWTYHQPRHDPAGAAERVIYWRRYDYIGSMIRKTAGGAWEQDDSLPEVLARTESNDVYVPAA